MFGLIDMEIEGIISGSMPTRTGPITNARGKPLKQGSPAYNKRLAERKAEILSAKKKRERAAAKKPATKKAAAKKQAPAKKTAAKKVAAKKKAPTTRPTRR
jgi:hypothetical protein